MERFQDGTHVRLRSRSHNAYVYAAEDGLGVALRLDRASLNAAWAVHRLVRDGTSYVLFYSAAYGRYLGLIVEDAPPGQGQDARRRRRVGRVVQRVYGSPEQVDVMWEAFEAEDGSGDVVMRNQRYGPLRNFGEPDTMMSWIVEAIPPREDPPELPEPPPAIPQLPVVPVGGLVPGRRRVVLPPEFRRRIKYVRANHQGHFNPLDWRMLWFNGRSVFLLRGYLAAELGEVNSLNITLCVRAGSQGRWTPLVIDLPAEEQTMEIVVFTTESEAAEELVYPDVDA